MQNAMEFFPCCKFVLFSSQNVRDLSSETSFFGSSCPLVIALKPFSRHEPESPCRNVMVLNILGHEMGCRHFEYSGDSAEYFAVV
ncbi:unnamed protein product [Urochloa humidicola]